MGWFIAGFVALRIVGLAFLVLLISRIVMAFRGKCDHASEILRGRLASGEITEEQYRHLREALDA